MLYSALSPLAQPKPENAVTVAVSSRVLFRTEREQQVFDEQGIEEYLRFQVEHENEHFPTGPAFPFVKVRGHTVPPPVGCWTVWPSAGL